MVPRWSTRGVSGQDDLSEAHVALAPKMWKRSSLALRGVVYGHGRGEDSTGALTGTVSSAICNAAVDAGLPVLAADNGGTMTWGNDACITKVGDAVGSVNTSFGAKSDKVLLVGCSMGTLAVLNWARTHTSQVAAIVLVLPITDLADIHDNNRSGFAAEIETAYTNLAGYTAGLSTHNPTQFASTFAGIPMRLYYSTDDTIATSATVSAFVAAVGGSAASSVSIGANGHSLGSWDPAAAATFLAIYA